MAITKTKQEVYEWFTTKNWFKSYERNLFTYPKARVVNSGYTNFKDYLDYAYRILRENRDQANVEFLLCDFEKWKTNEGAKYWDAIDAAYWSRWMCRN